ncbi:MAG: ABC transporter permease [Christensenellaceae bacterium]
MIKKFKEFCMFLKETFAKRELIWSLAKNDFKSKAAGSFFGIFWSFVIPIVTIMVFWFVFTVFKSAPVDNIPFIAWFVPAYVPWMFFSECMFGSVNCLYEYSYLVKKVKFRTSLLPIVKVVSCLLLNLFFIGFIFLLMAIFKIPITVYALQVPYYMLGIILLCIGISWLISSIAVFFKDLTSLVSVVMQLGFWLTPIFWSIEGMPPWLAFIARLNPVYYITQGMRDSFLFGRWFWQSPEQTIYFWIATAVIFVVGAMVFRKLRPHFADVL